MTPRERTVKNRPTAKLTSVTFVIVPFPEWHCVLERMSSFRRSVGAPSLILSPTATRPPTAPLAAGFIPHPAPSRGMHSPALDPPYPNSRGPYMPHGRGPSPHGGPSPSPEFFDPSIIASRGPPGKPNGVGPRFNGVDPPMDHRTGVLSGKGNPPPMRENYGRAPRGRGPQFVERFACVRRGGLVGDIGTGPILGVAVRHHSQAVHLLLMTTTHFAIWRHRTGTSSTMTTTR